MEVTEESFKLENKKTSQYLSDYAKLISEGKTARDKFIIICHFFGASLRTIKRKFGVYSKPKLLDNVTIKNNDGEFFCGNSWLRTQIAISNYQPESREHLVLDKGVFIDVGANIGRYTVMLGKQLKGTGTVVAIEPASNIFEIMEKNIKLNNLDNVIPLKLAVSDKKGTSDFYLSSEGWGTSSSLKEIKERSTKVKVDIDTLDKIKKRLNLNKINLIKIDVEGAEPNVLKGAQGILKKDKPKVVFEALNKECFKRCEKILKKFNYQIERLGPIDFIAYIKNNKNIPCN